MITSLRMVSYGSVISKEIPASMILSPCSMAVWVLFALTPPLVLSGASDFVMCRLRLVGGNGFYSLVFVRFNNFWWLAKVYCLDVF